MKSLRFFSQMTGRTRTRRTTQLTNNGYEVSLLSSADTRADSRFAPSQRETTLLCNDVSHWLGANVVSHWLGENLESALDTIPMVERTGGTFLGCSSLMYGWPIFMECGWWNKHCEIMYLYSSKFQTSRPVEPYFARKIYCKFDPSIANG